MADARTAENVAADICFALRSMRRAPAFTVAAVLTVALGIGASTAMFTIVNAALLRPLPIPQPDDFTYVGWTWTKGGDIPALTSLQYEFVREHGGAVEAVASYRPEEALIGDASAAQASRGLRVHGDFLRVMGFTPRLGRFFDARELKTDDAVVLLGDEIWRTRFGADPAILGRQIRLGGQPHMVVGVLPPEFRFPPAPANVAYLAPLVITVNPIDEGHNTSVIARWRSGLSEKQRAGDARALTAAFRSEHPALAAAGDGFKFFTHAQVFVESSRRQTLWVLFGAVSLVMLISCANTASLLLVRASVRQREIAIRASIGATPRRILQQLLTEGLVLSLAAASIGLGVAVGAVRVFLAATPSPLPPGSDTGVDIRVLGYAIGVSVITGVVFGLVAAGPALSTRLHSALLGDTRGGTSKHTRLRETLVLVETMLAVVLLCGAAVLGASFARLVAVDPGFDPDRVIAVRLGRLPPEYDSTRRDRLANHLVDRIRTIPGVEQAAIAPSLPFERGRNFPVDVADRTDLAIGAVELRVVSTGYLATLGVAIRGGRDFTDSDMKGSEAVAIVNEAFARHFWKDESPVDRYIQIGHFKDRWINPRLEYPTRVIGVAADIRELGLNRAPKPTVLLPRRAGSDGTPLLLVRGATGDLVSTLRTIVLTEDSALAPSVEPLSSVMSRSVAEPRFRTQLIGAFAGFAVLLAGIGIYGVIASVVQQRRREIGLRIALGANRALVAIAVARRCLVSVGAGAVAGLAIFWAARRVLSTMVFEISPGDPRAVTVAIMVLVLVAAFASWIPARRAAHTDAATALRD